MQKLGRLESIIAQNAGFQMICSAPCASLRQNPHRTHSSEGGGCGSVKKSASPADGEGPTSRQAQWEGLFYNRTRNPEAPSLKTLIET